MSGNVEKSTLSPIKQALLEIRRLRGQVAEAERAKSEPIAIVGAGVRYPGGSNTLDAYWRLLAGGVDAVIDVPEERWDVDRFYDQDPDAPGSMYVRQGGFLQDDVRAFDPAFFGISPREAQSMDPQQRLLMEVSWEALENAGLPAEKLSGSMTGVFIGIGGSPDYLRNFLLEENTIDAYAGPGATYSAAAGRISYFYGFRGPAMSVDTACSSSLVTTHLACNSLRSGECDMALVGGVTLHLQPHSFINQTKLRMVSPDGRCKAFDAAGNGVGRGEGCGVVVLKRLSDAQADGDEIIAVVRGSFVNQDGRTSGLTAPNGPSQQMVIRRALANAGIEPKDVSYLEAHGTGTALGDPIEIQAAAAVYGKDRPADRPLLVGSVKTNIGHLEEGAGVASLIKVALALKNGAIPPSLHFHDPNPYIQWDQLPVEINTRLRPWEPVDGRRLAGISSFGWSGTNAHIVLEAAPEAETPLADGETRSHHLLTLSARSEAALKAYAANLAAYLAGDDAPSGLGDVSHTTNTARARFKHRLGIVAGTPDEARRLLGSYLDGETPPGVVAGHVAGLDRPDVAFLFTGQGSQYVGMGRELYETQPIFRETIDRCDELLRPHMDIPLLDLLYPADGNSPIDQTAYTQPAIFAIEYALAQLWRAWGVKPAIVMGHSVGEYVAACVAGVFSLEDGLKLIAARGRLMQTLPEGGLMAAVFATEDRVKEALAPFDGAVGIAAINGPEIVVISGDKGDIDQVIRSLRGENIRAWPLAVSHALHTSSMDPILAEFETLAGTISYSQPTLKMVSLLTGRMVEGPEIADPAYWRRHMRDGVRFNDGMQTLHAAGYTHYLEVGPNPALLGMGQLCVPEGSGVWVPSLRQNRSDWQQLMESVGTLFVNGLVVDWRLVDQDYAGRRRRLWLPTYPFQRQSYWIEPSAESRVAVDGDRTVAAGRATPTGHPLLGARLDAPLPLFQVELTTEAADYLGERKLFGATTLPAGAIVEMALAAGRRVLGAGSLRLTDLALADPVMLDAHETTTLQVVVEGRGADERQIQIYALVRPAAARPAALDGVKEEAVWREVATVRVTVDDAPSATIDVAAIAERCATEVAADAMYAAREAAGIHAPSTVRTLITAQTGDNEALGRLTLSAAARRAAAAHVLHPAVLDDAFVLLAHALGRPDALPAHFGAVTRAATELPADLWVHAAGDNNGTGTLILADVDGNVVATVSGVTLAAADAATYGRLAQARYRRWLYAPEWQLQPAAASSVLAGRWLLLANDDLLGSAVAAALAAEGATVLTVRSGTALTLDDDAPWRVDPARPDHFKQLLEHAAAAEPLAGAVYLWGAIDGVPADSADAYQTRALGGALHLVQALARPGRLRADGRLWLVTRGAQAIGPAEAVDPEPATLWGLGHVVAAELPALNCTRVDLDPAATPAAAAEALARTLGVSDREDRLALRGTARYGQRLVPNRREAADAAIRPDGTYLITGGMGALGRVVAQELAAQGARHLVLMGRSAPSAAAQAVIDWLTSAGVTVTVARGDSADRDDVARTLDAIAASAAPLAGVVHAAGVLDDGVLVQQNWDRFAHVMRAKVSGARLLHELTRGLPLDHFILFSSAAAVFGSPGQSNYAAANAYLNALAAHRRAAGLPGLALSWGGWADSGMAAGLDDRNAARWAALGFDLIAPDDGARVFAQVLGYAGAQLGIFPVRWEPFMRQFPDGAAPAFLEAFAPAAAPTATEAAVAVEAAGDTDWLRRLRGALPGERRDLLVALVREQAARVLGLDLTTATIDAAQPLRDLGLDSLMAVQLRNNVGAAVDLTLPATVLFNYPTVGDLAEFLEQQLSFEGAEATTPEVIGPTDETRRVANEPIAIVGMSARFPGADSVEAFWEMLRDGVDAISEVPADRWALERFFDAEPGVPGKMYTRWGGFLRDVDQFDPQFFGISRREAVAMDPQQRLLLEVSWEALERAGHAPESLDGSRTGVFVGIGNFDYAQLQLKGGNTEQVGSYSGSGSSLSMAAGRVSYVLGLQGPSMAIDTACSSSLVALHLAVQSLRNGECETALAGGVNMILAPEPTIALSQARMMADDGRCKTFSAAANGFVRSEGCGVVVLKRLSDAMADGDNILAVVRGTAVNQDGRSQGLTAPNGLAQENVLRQALAAAGVAPADVQYVEAHGTGTALGDPIEVQALGAVYGAGRAADAPLLVGSVKTNIGHAENAAGIAGLIKVILSLQHEAIPPHLHFDAPNPYIAWDELPIEVAPAGRAWMRGDRPRLAGLSSFGFSGTNVHAIIEEAPAAPTVVDVDSGPARPVRVVTLSARSAEALTELAARHAAALVDEETPALADVTFTLNTGRSHFGHRLAAVAGSTVQLQAQLAAFAAGETAGGLVVGEVRGVDAPKIAFLFSGQGAQYAGMGRQLYETEPVFRAALDHCAAILRPYLEHPLLSVLFPGEGDDPALIDQTAYTQPALFALEYALAQQWRAWGVEPDIVMGHSVGEYVAACVAGIFSLEDGLTLIAERGRLMQALTEAGTMAAVFTDESRVRDAIADYTDSVAIAAVNGPTNIVISGAADAVAAVRATLEAEEITVRPLTVSHAFHSPLMAPMLDAFGQAAAAVAYERPTIPVVSNVTGAIVTGTEMSRAAYWRDHVAAPVRFADGIDVLRNAGYALFLEVGPNPTLVGMGRRCWPADAPEAAWLRSLRKKREDADEIAGALAALYAHGVAIAWSGVEGSARKRLLLPTYPFQRARYWLEHETGPTRAVVTTTGSAADHPLLGVRLASALSDIQYETRLTAQTPRYLGRRQAAGRAVVPAAVTVEMALAAARAVGGTQAQLYDVQIADATVALDGAARAAQIVLTPEPSRRASIALFVQDDAAEGGWTQLLGGRSRPAAAPPIEPLILDAFLADAAALNDEAFYAQLAERQLALAPEAQYVTAVWQSDTATVARFLVPDDAAGYLLHPAFLDAGVQLLALDGATPVEVQSIGRIDVVADGAVAWCAARMASTNGAVPAGSLTYYAADGQPLIRLDGVVLRMVEDDAADAPDPVVDAASWAYVTEWEAAETAEPLTGQSGHWVLIPSAAPETTTFAESVAAALRAGGHTGSVVPVAADDTSADTFEQLVSAGLADANGGASNFVYLGALGLPAADTSLTAAQLEDGVVATNGQLLRLVQALAAVRTNGGAAPRLWAVTAGAQTVTDTDEAPAVTQAPLWGLGKAVTLEHARLWGGLIDLDPAAPDDVDNLIAALTAGDGEQQQAVRSGERYAARLAPAPAQLPEPTPLRFRRDGAYLITGGLGALGLVVARWLADNGASRLILASRTPLPPRAAWRETAADSAVGRRIAAVRTLEAMGVSVQTAALDIADPAAVADFVATYAAEGWPAIRGVIHAAGTLQDGSLQQMDIDALRLVMRPKVTGTWLLHTLLEQETPLDFCVYFSSAAALTGNAGQGNYAAANAFLDAMAHYRRARGQAALSVNWGAWADVGMAAQTAQRLSGRGRAALEAIPPAAGVDILGRLLGRGDAAQIGIVPLTPAQMVRLAPAGYRFLDRLRPDEKAVTPAGGDADGVPFLQQLNARPPAAQRALLETHLAQLIGDILHEDSATLDAERNLMEMGLDSLMIMELIQILDRELSLALYPTEVFERPTIGELAAFLQAELSRAEREQGLEPIMQRMTKDNAPHAEAHHHAHDGDRSQTPVVFVLSPPRSGSTLLRVMLAGHSRLFSPPELHMLLFESMGDRQAELEHSYLSRGLERALMELLELDEEASRAVIAQWSAEDISIGTAYARLQELCQPRILVDKSPSYTIDLDILERAEDIFSNAKYIHLSRHPYAVVDSIVRNRLDKLYSARQQDPLKFAESLWANSHRNIMDFLEEVEPGRHYMVQYEELVREPERVAQELCAFLEIPYEPSMLQPYEGDRMKERSLRVGDSSFFRYQGIDPAQAEAWKLAKLERQLSGSVRRVARILNYELPWPLEAAEETPAPAAERPSRAAAEPIPTVPRDQSLPLSFAQQRLLFLNLMEPGLPMYHLRLAMRVSGRPDTAALRWSLDEIVRRHEVLRTTYATVDGTNTQTINPPRACPWTEVSLTDLPSAEREAALLEAATHEIERPFDLAQDLMIRAALFHLDDDDHLLLVTMHHIASDGWSMSIVLQELQALYQAYRAGQPSPLAPLQVQYVDFARWQRERLQSEALQPSLVYWKEQLADVPVMTLPTDRPRPAIQTYDGQRVWFTLPADLRHDLRALSQKSGVTLFMTMLAAFKLLLNRYSGLTDVAVGTPIAGRNHPDLRELMGFFVNTLVMRTDLSGNPSFDELLTRVRQVTLDAFKHQDVPFDRLVEVVQPDRDLSHPPIFQVMFNLNVPFSQPDMGDITLTPFPDIPTTTSTLDIFMGLNDVDETLRGFLEYNTDLFDEATMERFVAHYAALLRAIVAAPETPVADLPLLNDTERDELLYAWNATEMAYPRDKCLHEIVAETAARYPERPALDFEGTVLTYAALDARANQLAHYLRAKGVGPETLVGLHVDRSADLVIGLLGILKAGGAYVPLDPAFPADRLAYMLADSQAPILITQESLRGVLTVEPGVDVIHIDTDWDAIGREPDTAVASGVKPENLAYVIYTSGSTGRPKGVQLQHQGVVNFLETMRLEPGLTVDDVMLSVTTLSFDISVLEILLPLTTGALLVLASRETAGDGERLIAELARARVTVMQATPATYRLMIGAGWEGDDQLKVLCGGEALPRQLANQILERCGELWNMYGPTETTIWSTVSQVFPSEEAITIGRPIGNTQCYVLDPAQRPVPIGVAGELYIGGDGVARGYLNRPELTAERFVTDPFRDAPEARMYRTGDLVRFLGDGTIEFLGRIDNQVKIRGFRIELGEIEHVLGKHPAIRQAVVSDRADNTGEKRLVAYYIPQAGETPTITELRRYLRDSLPDYMVPSNYVVMSEMPLTPNGKVNRRALPDPGGERPELGVDFVAPADDMERQVAEIWKDVLQVDRVGTQDNFFDLGGHSLLLAQVHSRVQRQLEVELPIIRLFQYPTIKALVEYLHQDSSQQSTRDRVRDRVAQRKQALARRRGRTRPGKE